MKSNYSIAIDEIVSSQEFRDETAFTVIEKRNN